MMNSYMVKIREVRELVVTIEASCSDMAESLALTQQCANDVEYLDTELQVISVREKE